MRYLVSLFAVACSSLVALAVSLSLSISPAMAAQGGPHSGGEPNNTGCSGVGNANSPCAGAPGAPGAPGGSSNNNNNNKNTNTNTNRLTNTQSQGQSQGQGQSQNNKQTIAPSQMVTVGGGSTNIEEPRQAPPAYAPGLVAAPETCMGAVAVGASSPFGGISFGTTYKSDDCELRMYARSIMALGPQYVPAAVALLAQNENVKKALRAAGLPIPGEKAEANSPVKQTSAGESPLVRVTPAAGLGAGSVPGTSARGNESPGQ